MGVHGLWELLAPVGRRVSVETLAGKKLAIDASIWMVQFMKAMRDEQGEMVRNAHLLGFFRRICKLLFLRTKPVFVFDGGTPALKRRTVIARRRQRENAQAKIRKTAEKLLLNQLKTLRLKELAKDIENQRQNIDAKGKSVFTDKGDKKGAILEGKTTASRRHIQEELDGMLAASLVAEESKSYTENDSMSAVGISAEEEDGEEDEEIILPAMHGKFDPAVLAALPPSMQLDLLVQMRERLMAENRQKYQKVKKAPERFSELQIQSYLKTVAFRREIDGVQKSAAGRGICGVQTSRIASEANREFIFSSSFTGDKEVLTSAEVERNDNGQYRTPTTCPSADSLVGASSTERHNSASALGMDEPGSEVSDDVETYLDEMGRLRVSRVRAMGIHMTRDLQRNLDLMREKELEKMDTDENANCESNPNKILASVLRKLPGKIQLLETSDQGSHETDHVNMKNKDFSSESGTSIEISFEDVEHGYLDEDDNLFTHLVAGDDNTSPMKQSFESVSDCEWEEGVAEKKDEIPTHEIQMESRPSIVEGCVNDETEVDWEVGFSDLTEYTSPCQSEIRKMISRGVLEEEADFQEAIKRSIEDLMGNKPSSALADNEKPKQFREETDKGLTISSIHQDNITQPKMPPESILLLKKPSSELEVGLERLDDMGELNHLMLDGLSRPELVPSLTLNSENKEILVDCHGKLVQGGCGNLHCDNVNSEPVSKFEGKGVQLKKQLMDTSCVSDYVLGNLPDVLLQDAEQSRFGGKISDYSSKPSNTDIDTVEMLVLEKNHIGPSNAIGDVMERSALIDGEKRHIEINKADFPEEILNLGKDHMGDETDVDATEKWALEKDLVNPPKATGDAVEGPVSVNVEEYFEISGASLEEEMLKLGKEHADLGVEQRRLERNAESVSSEMFAECQELLQMFGLPYIIAPMEAEAQCAYMELANLVDGVVTDDSDVLLFGARNVFKNIFDERKYVETYFMKDIENELGITREKLISMALLLGSDYTEGVSGIGIVNAIEVVNAFPEEDGLHKFREWIESPDPTILRKIDSQGESTSKTKGPKVSPVDASCSTDYPEGVSASNPNISSSGDRIQSMKQIFMNKHRNVSKNWHIPSSFPSDAVISAYASPQVDKSTEPFSWGKPDYVVLRKLCWEKFGWGAQKADELLTPVLREYNKQETQLRMEAFYTFNERFAKIRSRRIKKAVKGLAGNKSLELMDDSAQDVSDSRNKKRAFLSETVHNSTTSGASSADKIGVKKSRKTTGREPALSETGNSVAVSQEEGQLNISGGSNVRGRGRTRGRGRSGGRSIGRGRRKGSFCYEHAGTSSDDGQKVDCELELQCEEYQESNKVRRSARRRKSVKYTLDNVENDELGEADEANGTHDEDDEDYAGSSGDQNKDRDQNHCKAGDTSFENLPRNCLDMDGTFRKDEVPLDNTSDQLGLNQNCDIPFGAAESTADYLKMGGGFCLEEGDNEKDLGKCTSSPVEGICCTNNPNPSHGSGIGEQDEHDSSVRNLHGLEDTERMDISSAKQQHRGPFSITNLDHSNTQTSGEKSKEDGFVTSTVKLSPMPGLRRKQRRKN